MGHAVHHRRHGLSTWDCSNSVRPEATSDHRYAPRSASQLCLARPSLPMERDGLLELSEAVLAEPNLADVRFTRGLRQVHWLRREAPDDTLVLTHPRTSTEFFMRWEPESADRLAVLPRRPWRNSYGRPLGSVAPAVRADAD